MSRETATPAGYPGADWQETELALRLPVADPVRFAATADAGALAAARAGYEGRCFGGAFVAEITRLVARGPVRVAPDTTTLCAGELPPGGYVDAVVAARTARFPEGSVWLARVVEAGRAVVAEAAGGLRAPGEPAGPEAGLPRLYLAMAPPPARLAPGAVIAARLVRVDYDPLEPVVRAIAAVATPARPPAATVVAPADEPAARAAERAAAARADRALARAAAAREALAGLGGDAARLAAAVVGSPAAVADSYPPGDYPGAGAPAVLTPAAHRAAAAAAAAADAELAYCVGRIDPRAEANLPYLAYLRALTRRAET